MPCWSGFDATIDADKPVGERVTSSGITADKSYQIAMTDGEWRTVVRLIGVPAREFDVHEHEFDVIDALGTLIKQRNLAVINVGPRQ